MCKTDERPWIEIAPKINRTLFLAYIYNFIRN
jgi:hypothetical protein